MKRRSHFKHLFSIANADGDVESAELDLIIGLAEKFQMRTSEVTKIIKDPSSVQLFTPKSDGVRIEHLYDLVTVMLVDGHIDKRELDLCKSIAGKLGLQQELIDSLIRDLIEKALKGVAPEKAIEDALKNYG
ncbi:MAG: hypothetical protein P8X60_00315 [Robiginitalea sp.]